MIEVRRDARADAIGYKESADSEGGWRERPSGNLDERVAQI